MFMSAVKLIWLCINKNFHSENMQKEQKRCVVSESQLFPRLAQNLTSETQQTFYEYCIEWQQWETDAICVSIFINTQMIQITEVIHILNTFLLNLLVILTVLACFYVTLLTD